MFDGYIYNKGGCIFYMLCNYFGDEVFFVGVKFYFINNVFKVVEYNQLCIVFEEVSGQDLNWFFS